MAMSASSMASRIESNISAITPIQGQSGANANAYRNSVMVAMCQGIISEIIADATVQVTGVTAGTATATGTVTS